MNTTAVITGIVCYLLGLVIGIFSSRTTYKAKMSSVEKSSLARGRKEAEQAHAEASEDLAERMKDIRDNLLDTFDAYQGALQLVDEKFQAGAAERLSLTYEPVAKEQILIGEASSTEEIEFEPSQGTAQPSRASTTSNEMSEKSAREGEGSSTVLTEAQEHEEITEESTPEEAPEKLTKEDELNLEVDLSLEKPQSGTPHTQNGAAPSERRAQ